MNERRIFYAILALIALVIPFLVDSTQLDLIIRAVLLACAAVGVQLLMSYAGQISLGHAAFMGMGAYISGILSIRYDLPSILTIFIAVAATAVAALVVGYPLLRLRGYYLAIGTLAFGLAVTALINALFSVTGGPAGLIGVPDIGWGNLELGGDISYYFVSVLMFAAFFWYSRNLVHSRIGRALITLKNDENAAEAMGISTARLKLQVFVISAVFAGLSGAVLGHYLGLIVPTQFNVLISVELVIIIILGGQTMLIGSVVGALIWVYMSEFAQFFEVPRQLIIGVFIVLLVLFFEGGVSPAVAKLYDRIKQWTGLGGEKKATGEGETSSEGREKTDESH